MRISKPLQMSSVFILAIRKADTKSQKVLKLNFHRLLEAATWYCCLRSKEASNI